MQGGGGIITFARAPTLTAPARRHANIHAKIHSFQLANAPGRKHPDDFMKCGSSSFAIFDVNNDVSLSCVQCRETCPGMRGGRCGPHIFPSIPVWGLRLVAS